MSRRDDIIMEGMRAVRSGGAPSFSQLVRLIREVNPTDRKLSTSERETRYELKSKLQSTLIRHYGDLVAANPTEREGLVGLTVRSSGESVGHAVLLALDDHARSWVRAALDSPQENVERLEISPIQRQSRSRKESSLSQGLSAMHAYDFELARECFERALGEEDPTSAATALLSLFVDHLGMDEEAIALSAALPRDIRKHETVRSLTAYAYVRGRGASVEAREAAAVLLKGIEGSRVDEAWLALATAALDSDAQQEAEGLLDRFKNASNPGWALLQQRLAARRVDARAPVEAELTAAFQSGDEELAESLGTGIIARWPESKAARSILDKLAAQRSARRCSEECASACALELEEDFEKALVHARLALGYAAAERGLVQSQLTRIERKLAARLDEKLANTVAELLPTDEGLQQYAKLSAEVAKLVHERSSCATLWLLDELRGQVRPELAAQAAVASQRASQLAERDPEQARSELLANESVLSLASKGRAQIENIRNIADEHRRQVVRKALDEAISALDELQFDVAREALARSAGRMVDELAAEVTATRNCIESTPRDLIQFEKLMEAEKLPAALELARKAASSAISERTRTRWIDNANAVCQRIRSLFEYHLDDSTVELAELRCLQIPIPQTHSATWLREGTNDLIVATWFENILFAATIDCQSRKVRNRFCLRIPANTSRLELHTTSDTIWVTCEDFWAALDYSGLPRMWMHEEKPSLSASDNYLNGIVSPSGDYLWLKYDSFVMVVNPGSETLCFPWKTSVASATGTSNMVRPNKDMLGLEVCRFDGTLQYPLRFRHQARFISAAAYPKGTGMMILLHRRTAVYGNFVFTHVEGKAGSIRREFEVGRHQMEGWDGFVTMQVSRRCGIAYILFQRRNGTALLAYEPKGEKQETLVAAYAMNFPADTILIGDARAERVFAWAQGHRDEPFLVDLTTEPPENFAYETIPPFPSGLIAPIECCTNSTPQLELAHQKARNGGWADVEALLADDRQDSRHAFHLRALAALHLGAPERAVHLAISGKNIPGGCVLEDIEDVASPVGSCDDPWEDSSIRPIRKVAIACALASKYLSEGRTQDAVRLLDHRFLWLLGDKTSLALLVRALDPGGPSWKLRLAAAMFLAAPFQLPVCALDLDAMRLQCRDVIEG